MKWVTASDGKPTAPLLSAVAATHISPSQKLQTVNRLVINPSVTFFPPRAPASACAAVIKWIEYMNSCVMSNLLFCFSLEVCTVLISLIPLCISYWRRHFLHLSILKSDKAHGPDSLSWSTVLFFNLPLLTFRELAIYQKQLSVCSH